MGPGSLCVFLIFTGSVQSSPACRFPGAPAHCNTVFSDDTLQPGTVVTYYCEQGFELLGPSRRVCESDGRWTPDGIPFCVMNVAAGKAPMQISTEDGRVPHRALDGSTATTGSKEVQVETCSLTKPAHHPWWYVNLLEPHIVQLVRLDFGLPCCGWGTPAELVVRVGNNRPDLGNNPICNQYTGYLEVGQPLFLPCSPPMPGAFVSVHLQTEGQLRLSICEAFVYTDQALPIERCPHFRDQPPGSTATYNGKCYIFYNQQPTTFQQALEFCHERGGALVDESNPALQGFISWELWRRHRVLWFYKRSSCSCGKTRMKASLCPSPGSSVLLQSAATILNGVWSTQELDVFSCKQAEFTNAAYIHKSDSGTNSQYWLGAVRSPEDRTNWKWINGNDMTVSFWTNDDGKEDCARFDGDNGWLWVNTNCEAQLNLICQYKPTTCGRPEQPPNSTMVFESFETGASVEYSCDPGHLLVGPTVRTCRETGFYDDIAPLCKQINCGRPALMKHGRYQLLNDSLTYLSHVQYTCDEGYEMVGRARLVCDIDGKWNGPPPICHAEERSTSSSTSSTTPFSPTPSPSHPSTTAAPSTTRFTPSRHRSSPRPHSSPTPFLTPEPPRRTRPKTTTEPPTTTRAPHSSTKIHERKTTKVYERPSTSTKFYERPPDRNTTVADSHESPTSHVPHIIVADHRNNQIVDSGSIIRGQQPPRVTLPVPVDANRRDTAGARFNIGAVVALGVFGALVFVIAIITTAVILFRRARGKHIQQRTKMTSKEHRKHRNQRYKHHPDCNTVASVDSSSSESRSGLNRFYRQAWEELHEAAGAKHHRRHQEAPKDGAELVVSEVYPGPHPRDKRRHHHHHYHREARQPADWQTPHRPHHNHKRY